MWKPIASAPRDRDIYVAHPDCGCFAVRWDEGATNEYLCPGEVGIWVALDGSMTWGTGLDKENGPDRWCEIHESTFGWNYP